MTLSSVQPHIGRSAAVALLPKHYATQTSFPENIPSVGKKNSKKKARLLSSNEINKVCSFINYQCA